MTTQVWTKPRLLAQRVAERSGAPLPAVARALPDGALRARGREGGTERAVRRRARGLRVCIVAANVRTAVNWEVV